jgi:hypothetical protein
VWKLGQVLRLWPAVRMAGLPMVLLSLSWPVYQPVVVEDHLPVVGRCLGYQISKLWLVPVVMRWMKWCLAEMLLLSVL